MRLFQKVTTEHYVIGFFICKTLPGVIGRPLFIQKIYQKKCIQVIQQLILKNNSPAAPKRISWPSPYGHDVCKHCLSIQKIGLDFSRWNLINYCIELLEKRVLLLK